MRLTRQGEYAVRCILYLSARDIGKVVNRREIAAAMEIPEQFLGKIAQQLARFGFIEIVQGAKGGYRLLVEPGKITLLDVVESAIGEIFLNDCVMNPSSCRRSPFCSIHRVWEKARKQLRDTLRGETFETLLARENCLTKDGLPGAIKTTNIRSSMRPPDEQRPADERTLPGRIILDL